MGGATVVVVVELSVVVVAGMLEEVEVASDWLVSPFPHAAATRKITADMWITKDRLIGTYGALTAARSRPQPS